MPAKAAGQRIRLTLVPDSAPAVRAQRDRRRSWRCAATRCRSARCPWTAPIPTGTTRYEKRNIADEVPIWESDLCIQCGQCAIVCPHSVIRAKYYDESRLAGAPAAFKAAPINARGYPDSRFTLQVYVEDCTGCGVCVENCPAHSPADAAVKAINMKDRLQHLEAGRESIRFFETLPWADRTRVNFANVRGVQFLEPLFEFSGACAGLRRDAVSQADVAALRRSAADRQRDRLLVDLRRQPARRRRGPRTPTAAGRRGPTRSSRTTPSSASAIAWPSTARPRRRGPWRRSSRRESARIS